MLEFLPMDPEAASFANAEEYCWEVRTRTGQAAMHNSLNGVTEAPDVSEGAEFKKVPIVNGVISYGWNVQDELTGSRIGYNFGTRRAQLAREELARTFDVFMSLGGTFGGKTFTGLFNHSAITPFDADTSAIGDWHTIPTTTTVAPFFSDFHNLYNAWLDDAFRAGSLAGADVPDTLAMSDRIESKLRSTAVGTDNRMSLLEELKQRYPEISNWLVHRDLRATNGTSTDDRVVMYRRDPRVVAGAIPVAYQETPMIAQPYGQKVYAYGRIAPVEVFDTRLVKYLDVKITA
jgi:hypothetical protein